MFTLSSRTKLSSALAVLALAAAGTASAADRTVKATIDSVDYENNRVTVIEKDSGDMFTYAFEAQPKVRVNGVRSGDLSKVVPGQDVTLKLNRIEQPQEVTASQVSTVKGEILEINREQNLALVRPADGGAPRVIELPENVAVSGLGNDVSDLQEGHFVTLKYTAR
ncbi:hypothetical protein [Gilvimarinus xylanilyticus]|uniref:DUF5666 domain-containing protein n=1 Tax=Gilvimarinus xylanilyticus TaxID=2944139 RepID=A0A9X2KSE7_9GAMM|nr:hypothetical protein [Gilvimarinus xylanilyticus]MCP8898032.1 hypothetical protein [Gilvimarinus xylanilyticus]